MTKLQERVKEISDELGRVELPLPQEARQYTFTEVSDPSLDEGDRIDREEGNWELAGSHYWTIFEKDTDATNRARGLISAVQMLINHGELDRAIAMLNDELPNVQEALEGRDQIYYIAYALTKPGWIYEQKGDFGRALGYWESVKILLGTPQNENEEIVLDTARHFIGRCATTLATWGIDVENNYSLAKSNFEESLEYSQKRFLEKKASPANVGFQHRWLSVIAIYQGSLEEAEEENAKAIAYFQKHIDTENPTSGIMGYAIHDQALIAYQKGDWEEAKRLFNEELRIWTEVQSYERGQADALLGLALVEMELGNQDRVVELAKEALQKNPAVKEKGFI